MSTQTVGLWPTAAPLMTAVQPWTYRDTLTATELLHDLAKQLAKLIAWTVTAKESYDALSRRIDQVEANSLAALKAEAEKLREEIATLKSDLLILIGEVSVGGSCYDPTDGTSHKSVSDVMDRVYGYLRTEARFATDLDDDGLTVAQIDGLEMTTRQFDLDPENKTTHATK